MKSISIKYLLIIGFSLSLFSCLKSNEWTEEERQKFKAECSQTKYFDPGYACFTGFEFDEIDTIKVIVKNDSKVIDTIFVFTERENNLNRIDEKKYWAYIERQFNVNRTYEFYLGEDKPYVLGDMEMIMWAQYTMNGEGWGCKMGNYTIDGKKFEHSGDLYFKVFRKKLYRLNTMLL